MTLKKCLKINDLGKSLKIYDLEKMSENQPCYSVVGNPLNSSTAAEQVKS